MESEHGYLMNIASILYIGCYIPELYANYKNKNSNIYNVPEKVIIFIGTSFAFSYSLLTRDMPLILNYGPIFALDLIALLMRIHYAYKNYYMKELIEPVQGTSVTLYPTDFANSNIENKH